MELVAKLRDKEKKGKRTKKEKERVTYAERCGSLLEFRIRIGRAEKKAMARRKTYESKDETTTM